LAFSPETEQPLNEENEMAKDVAAKKNTDITLSDVDSFLAENAGAGVQNLSQDDLALPFLKTLSRQDAVLDDLPDAKSGDIYNDATMEVYNGEEGLRVIPCHYEKVYIEWAPRGTGTGAPVNIYTTQNQCPKSERSADDNKDYIVDGEGNYLETTAQHYVLVIGADGTTSPALMSMKSTQLKKSRTWNTLMTTVTPIQTAEGPKPAPCFTHYYNVTTTKEENSKGSWTGWKIVRGDKVDVLDHLRAAASLAESFAKGEVKVKHEQEESSQNTDVPF
jgi:hypothetical protein